jgi:hypothetical protein
LGNANTVEIVVRQGELRLRVAGSGGLANSVEIIVRRLCRWLGRVLYRCARAVETSANAKKAATVALVQKLIELISIFQ